MKYRALGNDLAVSAVSLGCMGMPPEAGTTQFRNEHVSLQDIVKSNE